MNIHLATETQANAIRENSSTLFVPHTLAATRHNLRQLATIRMLVLVFMVIATIYGLNADELRSARYAVLTVIGFQCLVTLATFFRLNADRPISETEFFLQLLIDVIFISLITYFTGGATNPFVSYYLVPISIAAATISGSRTAIIAMLSVTAYTLLLFFYQPLDFFSHSGQNLALGLNTDTANAGDIDIIDNQQEHSHHVMVGGQNQPAIQTVFNAHYLGMWFNFLVSAVLIAWFVARMAQTVREQDQAINQQRESQIYDEQILSIATLAAGTAHELGTPLNSLQLLIDDLSANSKIKLQQGKLNQEELGDIEVMQTQIEACRLALTRLSNTAQQTQPGEKQPILLLDFVEHAIESWLPLRPEVNLVRSYLLRSYQAQSYPANPNTPSLDQKIVANEKIVCDQTLTQAFINLLNNAANASVDYIDLDIQKSDDFVNIIISDRGNGIPDQITQNSGHLTPLSESMRQGKGMGLGLFLSNATIHRHGGTLLLRNKMKINESSKTQDKMTCAGAEVTIRLPILMRHGHHS